MIDNEVKDMFREIIDIIDNLGFYQDYGRNDLYLKLSKMRKIVNKDGDKE